MMSEVLNFFTQLGVPQTLIILGLSVAGAFAYGKKWQYSVDKGALEAAKSALEAAHGAEPSSLERLVIFCAARSSV
jgi:hypothetical protein